MAGQTIVVSVLGDTAPLKRSLDGVEGIAGGLKKGLAGLALAAGAAFVGATAAVGGFALKSIEAASGLEQAIGGVDAVFKENSATVHKWAADAAKDLGLNKTQYSELATVIGSQLGNMGIATDQIAGQTNDLIGIGADLAAQFGGSTSDAVEALSSLMRGERDPIEKYGVSISAAAVQAKMAEMGLVGLSGEALKAGETQATLALLADQTSSSLGAFARESNTLAGQQARLNATWDNTVSTLGTALLPAATAVTGAIGDLLDRVTQSEGFDTFVTGLTSVVAGLVSGQSPIADFISKAVELMTTVSPLGIIFQALQPILPQLSEAFGELGSTLSDTLATILPQLIPLATTLAESLSSVFVALLPLLPPIVELATALISLLVPILEPLIGLLTALLPPITDLITNGLGLMMPIFLILIDVLKLVADLLGVALTGAVKAFGQLLKGDFQGALQTVSDGWTKTWDLVKGFFDSVVNTIKTKAAGMVSFFTEMASNIAGVMVGFRNGVQQAVANVVGFFVALPGQVMGAINGLLGSLASFGANIISGLVGGISGMANSVINAVKRVIGDAISFAKKLLGIASPSKVFRKIGDWTVKGLAKGLRQIAPVTSAMSFLSNAVTNGFDPSFSMTPGSALAGYEAASAGGNVYNIHLPVGMPSAEAGREIKAQIEEFERFNGRAA